MSHPLQGADLATLLSVLRQSGLPSGKRLFRLLGISGAAVARAPFSVFEKAYLAQRMAPWDELPPPIFIIGHWRSGTTHLYNTMAKGNFSVVSPIATGMPWDFVVLGALLKPFLEGILPKSRHIDGVPVTPDAPQEDEFALAAMTPLSFYHGIYFPSDFKGHLARGLFLEGCSEDAQKQRFEAARYFFRKIAYSQNNRQVLIKNPAYSCQIAQLLQLFPNAKFIHIHRNPYDVFPSMCNFYRKLLPVYGLQNFDHIDIEETVLGTYDRLMDRLLCDTEKMSAPQFVEVGYDALDRDPIGTLKHIYGQLALEGFDNAGPAFVDYLDTVKTYQKNQFRPSDDALDRVGQRWRRYIDNWGYGAIETQKSQIGA